MLSILERKARRTSVAPSHRINRPLLPFQQEDVDYLGLQPSVLVANSMGTGKTWEALERDLWIREKEGDGRTLIVAPLSTHSSWEEHILDLTELGYYVIDPKDRDQFINHTKIDCAIFVLHFEALRLMPELAKIKWQHIIVDECQKIKNRKAQQTKALKKIKAPYKTAMSGTPMVNRPDELWSVLNWLYPKTYTSYWRFYRDHVDFDVTPQGYHIIRGPRKPKALRREITPFTVRRLKEDVLPQLPEKYYTKLEVVLHPQQRRAYDKMRKDMIAWVGSHEDRPLVAPAVIAQLMRLQQLASASVDVVNGSVELREPSAKLDALLDLLDAANGGSSDPIVVFSAFSRMIRLVAEKLSSVGVTHRVLTGDTPQSLRGSIIKDFQAGKVKVLLATIATGGTGITLHRANKVCFLDRSWSPAENQQAEDRLHRIGQRSAVQVIDIMAKGTIDQGKNQKLELKADWIRKILG